MKGSHVVVKNLTGVESPIPLDQWEKIKDRPDIKAAFKVVESVIEPPEVASRKKQEPPKKERKKRAAK